MSNITLNIVEPASPIPTEPVIPNTGMSTSGIGGAEAAIIVTISLVVILAIVGAFIYRKKKQGKSPSLFARFKHTKSTTGLAVLALLVSIATVAGLVKLTTSAIEGSEAENAESDSSLTVDVSDTELTIELADDPVFAVLPVDITVEEATLAGYTLTASTNNTSLVSTTDSSNIIPMVAYEDTPVALTADTYGLSLVDPDSALDSVFTSLSTDQDNPTFITDKDYEPTEAEDTTTIYYGFYITPDIPYGTYTGSGINYEAIENTATVIYDGNGLYFNGDETQTTNIVKYIAGSRGETVYSYTPNIDNTGAQVSDLQYNTIVNEVKTVEGAENLRIVLKYGTYDNTWDYVTFWQGSHPEYTAKDDYDKGMKKCGDVSSDGRFAGNYSDPVTVSCDIPGDTVTFGFWSQPAGGPPLGYGYYATITGYTPNNEVSGVYQLPSSTVAYEFLGWSDDKNATTATYPSQSFIETNLPLAKGETVDLYAIWSYATKITFDKNGADGTETMGPQLITAGTTEPLTANVYTNTGYIFAGWNTVPHPTDENPGTSYQDAADFVAIANQPDDITLYAQWVLPNLTFTAGEHIDTLIVIDSSENWKPYYATSGNSKVFTTPTEGTKYIVTVVPEPGYVLSSDSSSSSYVEDFSTGTLASNTLLTTTYTAGSSGDNITVSVARAGSDSAHPAYTAMQNLTTAECPAYTDQAQGINVTDSRDNKSYTVAKFGNYCYMLSNLRLDGGTELTTATSNVSTAYILPADTGSGGWANDYCQPRMASTNGEYYYNWPAATARTNSVSGSSTCTNDTNNSVGDICPSGWSLPTYQDITPANLWVGGTTNPGKLYTSGSFYSTGQGNPTIGVWWSKLRTNDYAFLARDLNFSGTNIYYDAATYGQAPKEIGFSVRCMRNN